MFWWARVKLWALFFFSLFSLILTNSVQAKELDDNYKTYGAAQARKVSNQPKRWITTDHSKHKILQQDFKSPEEVTKACLSCHNEAALQVHKTIHWTWKCPYDPDKKMGKAGLTLNNF
ncbi:hypothetical protein KFV02_11135 [Desulfohalobiaceae bacterium Ax17]|jgi:uncharacterized paraquat-inducible protein A|nr:hypothetical protein [Desulfovulcanus ferrireducens]